MKTGRLRVGSALSTKSGVRADSGLPVAVPKPAVLPKPKNAATGFDPKLSKLFKRNTFGNFYQNPDGTVSEVLSASPVNVKNSSGSWVPISTKVSKRSDGSFSAAGQPLAPTFAKSAAGGTGGVFSVARSKYRVSFSLIGAKDVSAGAPSKKDLAASGGSASAGLSYAGVLPGADLTYRVEKSMVKEAIVLSARPSAAAPSYVWRIHAPGLSPKLDSSGDIDLDSATGAVEFMIPTPVMQDSSAIPGVQGAAMENIATSLAPAATGGDWLLTLLPDPAWLDDPARVFPVSLDPSVLDAPQAGVNAYESNGTHLTGVTYEGNSRAGSQDTYWRTVETYNYTSLSGYEPYAVGLEEDYAGSGTTTAQPGDVWGAGCFGFNCVSGHYSGIEISSGGGGYGVATDAGLFGAILQGVLAACSGCYYELSGNEAAGSYTFKQVNATLIIDYAQYPIIGLTGQSVSGGVEVSPQGGGMGSETPVLQAVGSDPVGLSLAYKFEVSTNPNPDVSPIWVSGVVGNPWVESAAPAGTEQVQVPPGVLSPGTTYYWKAYDQDPILGLVGMTIASAVVSWHTTSPPTVPSGSGPPVPADPSIVASTTPTLSSPIATGGTTGLSLTYSIRIASGPDATSGQIAQSANLTPTSGGSPTVSWQVPAGLLKDGGVYTWALVVGDQYGDSWVPAVNHLTVSLRVANPGPAPTDTAGPVSVNLANGNVAASFTSPMVSTVGGPMGFGFDYDSQAASDQGLTGTYFDAPGLTAPFPWASAVPVLTRTDSQVDFNWNTTAPAPVLAQTPSTGAGPGTNFQAKWTGFLTPPPGSYNFGFTHDDGVQLFFDNSSTSTLNWWSTAVTSPDWGTNSSQTLVVTSSGTGETATLGGTAVPLPLPLTIEYWQGGGDAVLNFMVEQTGSPATQQTVPGNWLTTTPQELPAGWQGSGAIAGDADEFISANNQGGYVTLTDVDGNEHTYTQTVNAQGVPTGGYTPPPGESGVLSLDVNGNLSFTDASGTSYLFDSAGQVTTVTTPEDAGKPAEPIPTYVNTSSLSNALRSLSDPLSSNGASPPVYGRQVVFGYSADTVQSMTAATASPSSSTSPACSTPSGYSPAPPGMICVIQYPDGSQTQLLYDANGNLARIIDPGSAVIDFGYTQLGSNQNWALNVVRSPLDNDWLAANPSQTASATTETTIGYDSQGRGTSVTLPAPDGVTVSAQPKKTYTYPSSAPTGTATATTYVDVAGATPPTTGGGDGHEETVVYNAALQPVSVASASGLTSSSVFNSDDNPLVSITPQGDESSTLYDSQNRPTDSYGPAPTSCFPALPSNPQNGVAPSGSCPVTPAHTSTGYDGGLQGLNATWFGNETLSGVPAAYSLGVPSQAMGASPSNPTNSGAIDVDWGDTSPIGSLTGTGWTAQFTGLITFPTAGTYTLYTYADDGTQLWLNDNIAINNWGTSTAHYSPAYAVTVTAGQVMRIRLDYLQASGPSHLELDWAIPGTSVPTSPGSDVAVPGADLSPDYSLVTSSKTYDSVPSGVSGVTSSQVSNITTTTNFSTSTDGPWLGLAQSSTVDPTGDGSASPLNLTSTASYETPGSGYLRQTGSTKPAGAGTAASSTYYPNTTGYGTVLGLSSPVCGLALTTPQYGMLETSTGPAPAAGPGISTTTVYDQWGRVVGGEVDRGRRLDVHGV
ncbi:MAG: PA14 domain-containing protein [Galbitalea sp.]